MIKKFLKIEYLLLLLVIFGTSHLRFKDLGYSDYIGDEHKAFLELKNGQNIWNFFMDQRKGPLQFLVSHIPYSVTGDFRNEFAQRVPFAITSVLSVLVFYLFVRKITNDGWVALVASFLYSVNGFIAGFGRIAQYQNLNLLFSFLSLYFYASLLKNEKRLFRDTLLGTTAFSLSVLSHWDAIFTVPVIVYIFIRFILRKEISKFYKIRVFVLNFALGCLILLPFLIPYVNYQIHDYDNSRYFSRRVSTGYSNLTEYKVLVDLYNPLVTFWFISLFGLIGTISYKKALPFVLWFCFSFGVFEVFVRKPGTHIYNFIIPAIILSSLGVKIVYNLFPKFSKVIPGLLFGLIFVFLYFQTYMVFVDHKKEYPWEQKNILPISIKCDLDNRLCNYFLSETPKYNYEQKLPLFGFPHKRFWNQINAFVNEQNAVNNEKYGYATNEVKTISEWYMNTNYRTDSGFYFIGIRKPLSFVNDWDPPQIKNKVLVKKIYSEYDDVQVKIYRVSQ